MGRLGGLMSPSCCTSMRIQTGQDLNPCTDWMNCNTHLQHWVNFEAEIDRMFALLSELNRSSEIMGNAARNTGLWNPLLYLLLCFGLYLTCFKRQFTSRRHNWGWSGLTEEESQAHPKEDCHCSSVYTDSWRDHVQFTCGFGYHEKNFKAKYNSKAGFRKQGCSCLALE